MAYTITATNLIGAISLRREAPAAALKKAIELDPRDSAAHSVLGLARMVRGDHAGATGRPIAGAAHE